MKYEPVIGLEVHVELNTKTKMFCRCSADYFGKKPNTHTCPVCLGLPGALPYPNIEALKKCIKIGLALNCRANKESLFERKNYFYPDLAKGYQISQYRWPICTNGFINVENKDGTEVKIRINRAHQEEDTGKLTHQDNDTLIDFNRSGVPLVEIVTEPDFNDSYQIKDYAKKLQTILQTIGVSSADMEKGDMRLEANISVRPSGQKTLPNYRVELKNINSFRFMVAAVEYEIERQTEVLKAGGKLFQETRGYNEGKKITFQQRSKEEANDYRYFPEPDLPTIKFLNDQIDKIQKDLPELPNRIEEKYIEIGISKTAAKIISSSHLRTIVFEEALKNKNIDAASLATIYANVPSNIKSQSEAEKELENLLATYEGYKQKKSQILVNTNQTEEVLKVVVKENPKIVTDYKNGNENAIQALIGIAMKKTQGKLDAPKARIILEKLLK